MDAWLGEEAARREGDLIARHSGPSAAQTDTPLTLTEWTHSSHTHETIYCSVDVKIHESACLKWTYILYKSSLSQVVVHAFNPGQGRRISESDASLVYREFQDS